MLLWTLSFTLDLLTWQRERPLFPPIKSPPAPQISHLCQALILTWIPFILYIVTHDKKSAGKTASPMTLGNFTNHWAVHRAEELRVTEDSLKTVASH